jgi:hypothetical protein
MDSKNKFSTRNITRIFALLSVFSVAGVVTSDRAVIQRTNNIMDIHNRLITKEGLAYDAIALSDTENNYISDIKNYLWQSGALTRTGTDNFELAEDYAKKGITSLKETLHQVDKLPLDAQNKIISTSILQLCENAQSDEASQNELVILMRHSKLAKNMGFIIDDSGKIEPLDIILRKGIKGREGEYYIRPWDPTNIDTNDVNKPDNLVNFLKLLSAAGYQGAEKHNFFASPNSSDIKR